ncbi:MAG: hypothetical protein ACI97A_000402 [Planctomycetota bacterium]|jgi:hypothetical protein
MIKSQIFALSFILMFMPGLPDSATETVSTATTVSKTKAPVVKIVNAKKVKAPASFKGFSSADLKKLKGASSKVSEAKMSKKGEVAKNDSTFTWEYVLIFLVIAVGAAISLLVI